MGASISAGIGMKRAAAMGGRDAKVFAFIGDSTFFHSGITGLIDSFYNNTPIVTCILDNNITAMTGHQDNPGTGKNAKGEVAAAVDIETIVRAIGFKNIRVVDPYDLAATESVVKEAYESNEPFVIITKRPCALIKDVQRQRANIHCTVDASKCKKCKACLRTGCPALAFKNGSIVIDISMCNGCGLCMQVCKFDAIEKVGE